MKKQKEKIISEFVSEEIKVECPMTNKEVMAKIDFSKPRKQVPKKSIIKVLLLNLAYIALLCFCVLVTIIVTKKQLINDWGIDEGKIEEVFGSTVAILPLEDDNIEIFYKENDNMLDYYVKVIFNNKKTKMSINYGDIEYNIKYNKESVKVCSYEKGNINTIEFDIVYCDSTNQKVTKHFLLQH